MKRWTAWMFLLASVFILSCGGGGGGGSDSDDGLTKTYRGKTTSAPLAAPGDAAEFAGALFGGSITQGMGVGVWSSLSSPARLIPHLQRYSLAAATAALPASAQAGDSTPQVFIYYGDISGNMTTTFWIDSVNGNARITRIGVDFKNYCDSSDTAGITWSGSMRLTPTAWYVDGFPAYFDVSWSLLLEGGGLALSLYGTMSYTELDPGAGDFRKVFEWDSLLLTDPLAGTQAYFVGLRSVDQEYLDWTHADEDLSGRVYVSAQGYVDLETIEIVETQDILYEDYPSTGKLKIVGKDGTNATITFSGAAPEVTVEVDSDADGSTELTEGYAWNEIVPF